MNIEDHPGLKNLLLTETPLMVIEGYLVSVISGEWFITNPNGVGIGYLRDNGELSPALAAHHRGGHITDTTLQTLRNLRQLHA